RNQLIGGNVLEIHRSVITFGTLKSFTDLPASELPVRGTARSSRNACFVPVTTRYVGETDVTSRVFSCSTCSTIRLNCSANSFFSFSGTSRLASFATYSTSVSLILICNGNLRDFRTSPWFINLLQKLAFHAHQLFPPDEIRN